MTGLIGIACFVNWIVTEPYMDEPFHVKQVQAYCQGAWSQWNPKISTPPGTYWITIFMLQLLHIGLQTISPLWMISNEFVTPLTNSSTMAIPPSLCALPWLRSISLLFGGLNLLLCRSLLREMGRVQTAAQALLKSHMTNQETNSEKKIQDRDPIRDIPPTETILVWNALNAWLQPISLFYCVLYYTETFSLFVILIMYRLARSRWYYLSAMVSFLSIFFMSTLLA
jgi:alpha-1,2-glucosyltransferase